MKTKVFILNIVAIIVLLFVSCDDLKNTDENGIVNRALIKNDILEASLLVKATQQNLNTIALCNAIEKFNDNEKLVATVKHIKEEQLSIYKSLESIAKENMILVANTSNFSRHNISNVSDSDISTDGFIEQIQKNISAQKEVLDSLANKSDNLKMSKVAEESIKKLKSNIKTTEIALEGLR